MKLKETGDGVDELVDAVDVVDDVNDAVTDVFDDVEVDVVRADVVGGEDEADVEHGVGDDDDELMGKDDAAMDVAEYDVGGAKVQVVEKKYVAEAVENEVVAVG